MLRDTMESMIVADYEEECEDSGYTSIVEGLEMEIPSSESDSGNFGNMETRKRKRSYPMTWEEKVQQK